jgi:cell division protein FtsB
MSEDWEPQRYEHNKRQISSMQFVFVVILAIGLLLALNLSGRIAAGQRIQADRQRLEREIAALEATQAALREESQWVQNPAFVERWARSEGKMVRPGEVLVVPVPAGEAPTPTPLASEEEAEEIVTWRVWWNLFFDSPPPVIE